MEYRQKAWSNHQKKHKRWSQHRKEAKWSDKSSESPFGRTSEQTNQPKDQ